MIKHAIPGSRLLTSLLAVTLLFLAGDGFAAALSVTTSFWDVNKGRLVVRGSGPIGAKVTIRNAGDNSLIAVKRVRNDETWRYSSRLSELPPCEVRVISGDEVDERSVKNAVPPNCDNGAEPPPPEVPNISIGDVSVDEGAGSAIFNVTLSAATSQAVSVAYATSNGDAVAGEDYSVTNGTLTIPANSTSGTIEVAIIDDTADEPDQTFNVDLGNAVNGTVSDSRGVGTIVDNDAAAPPPTVPAPEVSINSTSQNSSEAGLDPNALGPVPEAQFLGNNSHKVLAINDLGMHCGDLDTRVSSILPPFQVLLAQVIERGGAPKLLGHDDAVVTYSAVSNPNDPILENPNVFTGVAPDGSVFKTNFWEIASKAYGPFYPPGVLDAFYDADPDKNKDIGLPVPNVEVLYLGNGDLLATQHAMPGMTAPYLGNDSHVAEEFYINKPFFTNFPFGYVAEDLNWFEAAGVPFAAFDDFGRENPYPLVRVQADVGGNTVATTDTVLPISGEANCKSCHSADVEVSDETPHAGAALKDLDASEVATAFDDDPAYGDLPLNVSIEYATDINVLRLHDQKHGTDLMNEQPVVCQRCHYTPALDLAQFGPLGPEHPTLAHLANGRDQLKQSTMSNVMHSHHGATGLFPEIPPANQLADGTITNQTERLEALEQNCYQCHPGKNSQCLRGAMFNGGMVCSDCHGSLAQVGDDFSKDVTPDNIGAFSLDGNFYTDADQPRVPWANEPGCGSCHTGDANSSLAGASDVMVNTVDTYGNTDGIRLRQAFKDGDPKATPIVPSNKRFAEPEVPASFNGTPNQGAGNPQLYRVSTGHGGVMCEGCHGATHAEWPNGNPYANDNVTADQLQGHTGTITECTTCHETSQLPDDTQEGPHGMHLVNDRRFWKEGHKDAAKRENGRPGGGTCAACHGSDHRGTVLSRAADDRSFDIDGGRTVKAGEVVGCGLCHSLSKSFGG